jgi:hypothetical protein
VFDKHLPAITYLFSTLYEEKGKCLGCFVKKRKKQGNKPYGKNPIALNAMNVIQRTTSVAQWAVRSAQASGNADKASAEIEADAIKKERLFQ